MDQFINKYLNLINSESLRDKDGNKKGFLQNRLRNDITRRVREPQYNHGRSKHVSQVKIIYK